MNVLSRKSISARLVFFLAATVAMCGFATNSQAQQSFVAVVDGKPWESDNDGITVIPVALGTRTAQ